MSLHRDDSQVATLNRHGTLAAPQPQLLQVLNVAQDLSRRTGGAFDITVQPLWLAFSRAQQRGGLPTAAELSAARARVGWQGLEVTPQQLRLREPGMAITLNGLAQGFGVDVAMQALRDHGIAHALLDTGEFGAIGDKGDGKIDGEPWRLGIKHPRQPGELAARLRLDGRCLATSGDYETAFSADFLHHHIFDPATGDSPTALASATVLAPSGILADGLSTAFMVLGAERALHLAARMDGVDALLIGKNGQRWQTAGMALLAA
jgi:thiamine biosynthesis lipoprotein